MTKLKSLLEGFAWERKPGKPLPTLSEVQAEYEAKKDIDEKTESEAYDDASANELASYISQLSTELSNETDPAKIKMIKQDIADVKQKLNNKKNSNRWQDSDGDGKWYEPGEDVKAEAAKPDYIDADGDGDETESMKQAFRDKEKMQESFINRIKKNLIGGATRK